MNKCIFILNRVHLVYKDEFCIRYSPLGATALERVTDVTKFNINEQRNTAKEAEATGKQ